MDGVFMRKAMKRIRFCIILAACVWCAGLLSDKAQLGEEMIRLHVVGASDSFEDQQIKLRVKDEVVSWLRQEMANVTDMDQAKAYLQENLPRIQAVANQVLSQVSSSDTATVTLAKEAFPVREYDTFTLPSGVYEALRITIGEGEGRNWWCVVFPTLCIPATSDGFEQVAVGAGFSDGLTGALEGKEGYRLRFYLLDLLGSVENIFFRG